jgi:hypothetical protein
VPALVVFMTEPTSHGVQVSRPVLEKVPDSQAAHVVPLAVRPSGQATHAERTALLPFQRASAVPSAQAVQATDAESDAKKPAGQSWHTVAVVPLL